jgi:hypothetical protein
VEEIILHSLFFLGKMRNLTRAQKARKAELAKKYRKEKKAREEKAQAFLTKAPPVGTLRVRSNIRRISTNEQEVDKLLKHMSNLQCMNCGKDIHLTTSTLGMMIVGMRPRKVQEDQVLTFLTKENEVLHVEVEGAKAMQPIMRKGRVCDTEKCRKALSEVIPEWQAAPHIPAQADHEEIGWGYSDQKDYDGKVRSNPDWMSRSKFKDPRHVTRFNPAEKGRK